MAKKRGYDWTRISLVILVLILLIGAVYFTFFGVQKCDNLECFKSAQEECKKTSFIYNDIDIVWNYEISGKKDGRCVINVEVLKVKSGSADKRVLEEKSMVCKLPVGKLDNPEADLSVCSGVLKETLQEIMIQKLHKYLLDNLGKIEEGLESGI